MRRTLEPSTNLCYYQNMKLFLHELPRGSRLKVKVWLDDKTAVYRYATFHHIDGSYSLCSLDDEGDVSHLYALQEMIRIGDHYELATADAS